MKSGRTDNKKTPLYKGMHWMWRDDWCLDFSDHFGRVSVFENRGAHISFDVINQVHDGLNTRNQVQIQDSITSVLSPLRRKYYNPIDSLQMLLLLLQM